ncbi:MAG: SCO family protein [Gemmatimonadetes bacterium]|nr:SCO family protein [Gemmatimonadota bacterium]MYC90376.1 SCO family protein [Gemmatimonadota bacterium]MYG35954.1 SCO family protein [Gemmatimonadota bacterium]MYJ17641.1 SCO family protein [Gemmatimonadota bacterium]
MSSKSSARGALAALAALLVITVAWWALALWPVQGIAPAWLERARLVCFNTGPSGLPDASGWLLLVGQPIGMLAVLMVIAGDAVRAGLRRAFASPAGLLGIAGGSGVLVAGLVLAAVRVTGAPLDSEWLETARADVPATYPRLDRRLPPVDLVDQRGEAFGWGRVTGRPTLLTFGFGHCATICPMTVMNARQVQDRFTAEGSDVALVVITLDPWRDTPARLPSLARQFHLDAPDAIEKDRTYLLSGSVEGVNAALDALQVARQRVPETGDIVHPALVYLIDADGTIAYAASGHAELIEELARRM